MFDQAANKAPAAQNGHPADSSAGSAGPAVGGGSKSLDSASLPHPPQPTTTPAFESSGAALTTHADGSRLESADRPPEQSQEKRLVILRCKAPNEIPDTHQNASTFSPEFLQEGFLLQGILRVFEGSPQMIRIMMARFIASESSAPSLRALGQSLGMSAERIRQLQDKGVGLMTDYFIVRSTPERTRMTLASQVLTPAEVSLVRNLLGPTYTPLSQRTVVDSNGNPLSGYALRQSLTTLAVAATLTGIGHPAARDFLESVNPKIAPLKGLSAAQKTLILSRLFETPQSVQHAALHAERFRSAGELESKRRQFSRAAHMIAEPLRAEWRKNFGYDV